MLRVLVEVQGIPQELTVTVQDDPTDNGDIEPPVITLLGANPLLVDWGGSYSDPGALVTDNFDADRTINGTGTVNPQTPGNYTVVYEAAKWAGLQMGHRYRRIPAALRPKLSALPAYWQEGRARDRGR